MNCALVSKIDVFADRQVGEQGLLLEHHPDPFSVGVRRAFNARFLTRDEDLPRVGLIDAAQNLHEGRFAGAVLADETNHLSGLDLDRDVLQRVHSGEALADSDH